MKKLLLLLLPVLLISCNESTQYPLVKTPLDLQFFLAKQLDPNVRDSAMYSTAVSMAQQNNLDIPMRLASGLWEQRHDLGLKIAETLIKNNRKQESIDLLNIELERLKDNSKNSDNVNSEIYSLCQIANLQADAGDQAHALSTLEMIFQKAKKVPRDHVPTALSHRIGKVMGKIGDIPQILEWNKKLGWNTVDGSTIDGAAASLLNTKDLPTAMALAQTSKDINKFNAQYLLACILIDKDRKKEAEEVLNEATKTAAECKDTYRSFMDMVLVRRWLKLNRLDRAKEVVAATWNDSSLNEKTRYSSLLFTRDLSQAGYKSDALQILNQALETLNKNKDKNPLYYYRLAIIANGMAFTDEKEKTISLIEEVWTKLPSQDKEQKEIHGELATSMTIIGNTSRAIEMFGQLDENVRETELKNLQKLAKEKDFQAIEEKLLMRDDLTQAYCNGLSDEQILALNKVIQGGNAQEILKQTSQFKDNAWSLVLYAVNRLFKKNQVRQARDLVLVSSMSDLEKLSLLRDSIDLMLKNRREEQKIEDEKFVKLSASDRQFAIQTIQQCIPIIQKISAEDKRTSSANFYAFLLSKCLFQVEGNTFSPEGLKIKNQLLDSITL